MWMDVSKTLPDECMCMSECMNFPDECICCDISLNELKWMDGLCAHTCACVYAYKCF